ncbi:MAG TPA: TIGR00730 family Rossman fold protein [Thermoanaerobaculia bacterium]|nr:TIGR00730 family Rossman fold protein [Thermoanaerobaculia bacterium]
MEITRIVVYCSASATRDPAVETEIRVFGREIARRGIDLVYGGSSLGLMGALADEVLGAGGKVIGVIPKTLLGREAAHKGLTELKVVSTMHEREQVMSDLGDAFVAFPGGFGTLVEIIEMITWKQLGIHGKPIVIANIGGYFDALLQQFDTAIRHRYARPEDKILWAVAESTKAILTLLDGAPVLFRKSGDWA